MAAIEYREMRRKALEEARSKKSAEFDSLKNINILNTSELSFIPRAPSTLSYCRDVLSDDMLSSIISFCENRALWSLFGEWGHIGGRSVMILGGIPHSLGAIVEPLPPLFKPIALALASIFGGHPPNQILLNCYEVGQGIAHHNDGELYDPLVAIISLQSSAKMDFMRNNVAPKSIIEEKDTMAKDHFSIFLHPNSLLVFGNVAYTDYTHGIKASVSDNIDCNVLNYPIEAGRARANIEISRTSKRYSLTLRRVHNVAVVQDEFGSCTEEMSAEVRRRKAWWLSAITETGAT